MDALPSAFKNAFEKFVRSKLPEPESKPNTQFALTSCVFDTETKMLKVKIDPSSICKKIDLSKIENVSMNTRFFVQLSNLILK